MAFLEIRIKFHLGMTKGRGKRGYREEAQNELYFCKIPIIKQDTSFISPNCWSDKLLITTIAILGMPIPMAQLLRLHIQMIPHYGPHACIILETAHLRSPFGI